MRMLIRSVPPLFLLAAVSFAGGLSQRTPHSAGNIIEIGTFAELRGPAVVVYDNTPIPGGSVFSDALNAAGILEDATLFCGPGEPGPVSVSAMQFGIVVLGTTPQTFDALISFYNTWNPAATPVNSGLIRTVRVPFSAVAPGTYLVNTDLSANPFTLPDVDFMFAMQIVATGTSTYASGKATPLFHGGGVSVGTSDDSSYFDDDMNSAFTPAEQFYFGGPPDLSNIILKLTGTPLGPPPPPPVMPTSKCLGALTDDDSASQPGPLVISAPLIAGQVVWYQIVLTQDVPASSAGVPSSDTLDIHTDGSSLTGALPTDTVLSLYRAAGGSLVTFNDDAPNGTTGQNQSVLSFGDDTPRLTSPNLIPMGGEDGALSAGTYLIAVSAYPATALPCNWRHASTSTETGTVVLNIVANLNNQCPGDLNADRRVDEADLGILLSAWQTNACGDVNRDGQTSEPDLGILLANWQAVCP
ncbi:MAG: hypothetical protein U1D55_14520 [Phycisphaerae bacterium]